MAEEDALARVQSWWSVLDESTKSIFEQLYQRDPEGVIGVIGGGEVTARDGTLDAFLGNVDAFDVMRNVPMVVAENEATVDPAEPDANTEFTISWTERNDSQVTCPAYMDYVQVATREGQVAWEQTFDRPELGAGETSQFSVQVPGLAAETYQFIGYLNSAGIDPGTGMPDAAGFRGFATVVFGVGGFGTGDRPSDPFGADLQGINDAYGRLNNAYNSRGDEGLREVAEALKAFAAVLDTGGVLEQGQTYDGDLMVNAIQRAQRLEGIADSGNIEWTDEAQAAFSEEVMKALQEIYPLTIDFRQIDDRSAGISEAIGAIGRDSLLLY